MSLFVLTIHVKRLRTKIDVYKNNEVTLKEGIRRYVTQDSLNAIQIGKLILSKKEFKTQESALLEEIKKLKIKVGRLNAVLETQSEVKTQMVIVFHDSIIELNKVVKCLEYDDNYFKINACIENDTLKGELTYRDTLIQVIHRVPRKFLFIKFGTKAIKQEAYFKNKNAHIAYSRFIEIKK